jgi:hypothetical protein
LVVSDVTAQPVLLLVAPLSTYADAVGAGATLAELARSVRARRDAGGDVRLRVCRGSAPAEAAAAPADVLVAVVSLALATEPRDIGAVALREALRERGRPAAEVIAAANRDALARLFARAPTIAAASDALDLDATPRLPISGLHALAVATLRRAHVALAAEMFAGNHVAARNAALLENIVP